MKYELIPKDVLDEVSEALTACIKSNSLDKHCGIRLTLSRAYTTIKQNRTQCNVQPEGE